MSVAWLVFPFMLRRNKRQGRCQLQTLIFGAVALREAGKRTISHNTYVVRVNAIA
jgi:hypothetical protein